MSRKAIFLDRDGTLNEEVNYLGKVEDFAWLPRAAEAVRLLNEAGWVVVLITNQSGIGRGYYAEQDVAAIHERIESDLAQAGARLDAIYYCPHRPDEGCVCRKPQPHLFQKAAQELGLDLSASYAIGDKLSDLEPGKQLGCRTILLLTGHGPEHLKLAREQGFQPDRVAEDLYRAVEWISQHEGSLRL